MVCHGVNSQSAGAHLGACGLTHAAHSCGRLRSIHRLPSMNSVCSLAVFLASLRYYGRAHPVTFVFDSPGRAERLKDWLLFHFSRLIQQQAICPSKAQD